MSMWTARVDLGVIFIMCGVEGFTVLFSPLLESGFVMDESRYMPRGLKWRKNHESLEECRIGVSACRVRVGNKTGAPSW